MSAAGFRRGAVAASLAAALAGCTTVGPEFRTPAATLEAAWLTTLPDAGADPGAYPSADWWNGFGDATLTALLARARGASLTLQSTALRIVQARAQLDASSGNTYLQSGSLQTGAQALHYPEIDVPRLGRVPAGTSESGFGKASASWEFDFWGKYRRQVEADKASLDSSRAAHENARVLLDGQVASTYVDLRVAEARLRIAQDNLAATRAMRQLALDIFRAGAGNALDVSQADQQLAQIEAQLPPLEKSRAQTLDALAVLLGTTPAVLAPQLAGTGAVPRAPDVTGIGLPRDLLRRRPDVRQAAFDAASRSAAIGVAQAALLPSFSLVGSLQLTGRGDGSLFAWGGDGIGQLQAGFTLPIFDRGRLASQVRIQDAAFRQAVLNYQNTVLAAQKDVEDALAAGAAARRALEPLRAAVDAGTRAAALARDQYRAGAVGYQPVLDTRRALLQDGDALVRGEGAAALAAIALYGALGGAPAAASSQH